MVYLVLTLPHIFKEVFRSNHSKINGSSCPTFPSESQLMACYLTTGRLWRFNMAPYSKQTCTHSRPLPWCWSKCSCGSLFLGSLLYNVSWVNYVQSWIVHPSSEMILLLLLFRLLFTELVEFSYLITLYV